MGHAFGVRVDGVQKGRFLGLTGPMGRRVLKFDGPLARGLWYRPQGDEFYNAACDGHVHIEYHNQDYHRPHRLRWMASHWIRGSRGSPMNPVRLHTFRHFVALFP